ncbi:hypothetical protein ACO0TC_00210 [Pseudomonas aeruginosa]|uniref:hypothetical protein n=1 Tax=Pseudomonas aeruginosa TaxID=287 RepID=UPI003BF0F5CF
MIFSPLPGEYIASAILRGNEILGLKGVKKNEYSIKQKHTSSQRPTKDGGLIYPQFLTKQGISIKALYEHTLYPFSAAMGAIEIFRVITPSFGWKICLQCIIDDMAEFGTAYIHSSHLIETVSRCSKHGLALHESCPACMSPINKHSISKFTTCCDNYKVDKPELNTRLHRHAVFANDLMKYKGKPCIHADWMIHQKMEERQLLRAGGSGNVAVLRRMTEYLGIDFTKNSSLLRSPENRLAAAYMAYDTADAYLKEMKNLRTQKYH